MSQGNSVHLGIALICGGATYGLTNIASLPSGVGLALAVAIGGIVLIALGTKNPAPVEEIATTVKQKGKKEAKKLPSPQKTAQKADKASQKASQKVQKTVKVEPKEEEPEVPETPDKKKSKKKKKSGGTPLTSPASPSPQHVKPKSTSKVEEDLPKELSKTQLRKLKKKEAEEKQKLEDEKQRAAELARKAAEQKREAAQQKKLQAKARKAAQKAQETPEAKVETKQPQSLEPEEGWEVAPSRKSRGPKDGKSDSKEPIVIDVKVPPRQHALIIGKQGEGLKKLSEDFDVIITMPKKDSGDDLILIKGLPKDVYTAKKAIEETATKGYSTIMHPGWVTKQALLQSKGQLALVFGEKGSTLQTISKTTGTRLQMPEKGTTDFNVSVTGDERGVDSALALIQELLDQGYTKTTHPDWIQDVVQVGDPAILGAILGKGGLTVQRISRDNKVKIDIPKDVDASQKQDVVVYIRGQKKSVAKAKQAILDIIASREPPIEQEIPDPAWQEDVEEVAW